jgi:hypothetical protein
VIENKNFLRYFLRATGNIPDAFQMVMNYTVRQIFPYITTILCDYAPKLLSNIFQFLSIHPPFYIEMEDRE